ncbi:MAG TPA: glycosyltransferase family 2 protein [Candidatus Methanomethylicus sp.]|nr:glycosyltransferase family 2 protein [Candidatus Methanomethylicus sp.]HRR53728.1 glycosyltransferase family 2 protein [Candidatus Methanomethylicus sp.]
MISIVVPFLNEERGVKELLDTVVRQTFRPIELILVDGGSTDTSISTIQEFIKKNNDPQLKVRLLFENDFGETRSVPNARRIGLENAQGEHICFLDADFYLISDDLLSKTDEALNSHPWIGVKVKITPDTWLERQIMLDNSLDEAGISNHIYFAMTREITLGKRYEVNLGIYEDKCFFEGLGVPVKIIDTYCARHYPHTIKEFGVQRRWYGRSSWKYIIKYRSASDLYDLVIRPVKELASLVLAALFLMFNGYVALAFLALYFILLFRIASKARFMNVSRIAYLLFKTTLGEAFYAYGIAEGVFKWGRLRRNASRGG